MSRYDDPDVRWVWCERCHGVGGWSVWDEELCRWFPIDCGRCSGRGEYAVAR